MIEYIPRSEWGSSAATEAFLRNRYKRARTEVTSAQIHHTAGADKDATENRWSYRDAVSYMKFLQTARPDLIPLPYCDNIAVSEDLNHIWIFEGCGIDTVGAHTSGYNRSGYGIGILGNFDYRDNDARDAVFEGIQYRLGMLRHSLGFVNMGNVRNPRGWEAFGHRDTSNKSCPGNTFYPVIENIRYIETGATMHTAADHATYKAKGQSDWSPPSWAWFVGNGFTTKPDSAAWEMRREDGAHQAQKLYEMVEKMVDAKIEAALKDLPNQPMTPARVREIIADAVGNG